MPTIGGGARLLGYAGLVPQVIAVVLAAGGHVDVGAALALAYGGLILSFLGGIWWGFAMRRDAGQAELAIVSVLPSLIALALGVAAVARGSPGRSLVGLGLALVLTLMVDRRLVASGDAPAGWMALRAPLSLGLGTLTVIAGVLAWQ